MSPKRRPPLTLALALLLPVLLVVGLWLGGHPEDLPGFLRSAFVSGSQAGVVDEAVERIAHEYYRPIPVSKLNDASLSGVVASLDDRFSHYLSPSEFREFASPPHFTGIGVAVAAQPSATHGLLIVRVFNSSPAARAGLKVGDVIVAVNGRSLDQLSAETATGLIRGLPGTNVQLGIQAPPAGSVHTKPRSVKLTRAVVSEPVVESTIKTVHGVKLGVVALASFSPGSHVEVREAVEHVLHAGARGIVFDLRGNGGGLVEEAQLIASIFIPKGVIVTTRGRTQPTQVLLATGHAISPSIPMVVLVDSNTASSSEIVTAALQDHQRATVVGTHTFGKGVFQEEQPLSNGGALDITVGEYFTPNGRNLGAGGVKQGAGVVPEVAVPKSVVDTARGLDVALGVLAAKVK
jgi:carboxyl-terminal processing protease